MAEVEATRYQVDVVDDCFFDLEVCDENDELDHRSEIMEMEELIGKILNFFNAEIKTLK